VRGCHEGDSVLSVGSLGKVVIFLDGDDLQGLFEPALRLVAFVGPLCAAPGSDLFLAA
jgi:hypothetical protein